MDDLHQHILSNGKANEQQFHLKVKANLRRETILLLSLVTIFVLLPNVSTS